MSSEQNNFRAWIEAGFKNYGQDPWFFIRELAQNSRDAGASAIKVKIGYTALKEEVLIFEDDGCGMSYHHARQFLFRLYASSKTGDKYSAGMFGIGFWTVLKFKPSQIIIESLQKKGKHAEPWGVKVEVAAELKTLATPSHLRQPGTRVTLIRPAQESSENLFFQHTYDALMRYCSYLRRNNRRSDPLPVLFDGKVISSPMSLPGPVSLPFKDGAVEGVVGLGPRPRVHLYVRGLPVWEGTSLEELAHTPPETHQDTDLGQGLAPVFLLNGNRLEVNISRQKVIDNQHLQRVRKTAEQALARMVENAADYIRPRTPSRRLWDKIKITGSSLMGAMSKTFLLILFLLIILEIVLIKTFYSPPPQNISGESQAWPAHLSLAADGPIYAGASVRLNNKNQETGFSYTPPKDLFFTLFYADRYQKSSGFVQQRTTLQTAPGVEGTEAVQVQLVIPQAGAFFLPQPLFQHIHPSSVTLNNRPVPPGTIAWLATGEVIVHLSQGGNLHYKSFTTVTFPLPRPEQLAEWLTLPPDLQLPDALETTLKQHLMDDTSKKLAVALRLTASLCSYDNSSLAAQQYANLQYREDWFSRVSHIRVGDCDIINGLNALFLRKMGVPARLVIGAVGRNGKILPILHAWTEYYDTKGRRGMIDASTRVPRLPARPATTGPHATTLNPQKFPNESSINKQQSHTKGFWQDKQKEIIYLLGALVVLLVIVLGFLLTREAKHPTAPHLYKQVEESLAGMALHTLVHSAPDSPNGGIMNFNIIPTCFGQPISLQRALLLGKKQKLFTASPENPLLQQVKVARTLFTPPILDSSNEAFAPLLKLLPGVVHLDDINALKVIDPQKAKASSLARLLLAVNQLLKLIGGRSMPSCWLAAGAMSSHFYDADLSALPSFPRPLIPNRFIAVNPSSSALTTLANLFKTNQELALFRFIHLLVKESTLLPDQDLMKKVAHHLLLHDSLEA